MRVRYIKHNSYVDGPGGPRTVLFMQGCSIRCPGCQNQHMWPAEGGTYWRPKQLAALLLQLGDPITISGGEPFDQPGALLHLLHDIRERDLEVHIIVYTGRRWEDLVTITTLAIRHCLKYIDVVVDGPYIAELDDDYLQWRGSRNQRPIDVAASLAAGYPIELDWDTQVVTITEHGNVLLTKGLAQELCPEAQDTPRCGELTEKPREL